MSQHVGYCTGPTGEEVAFAVVGDGPPLVLAAWWTSHLELDWQNRELREFILALAENHTVIRYDRSGVGMSGRDVRPYDLETEAAQLQAVIDATAAGPVDLLGISCGGPPCVRVATSRPDAVRRLVFIGSYANGQDIADAATRDAVRDLVVANWGLGSATLAGIFLPDADSLTARRFSSAQRHTTTADVAANLLQLTFDMDVSAEASEVTQPALVVHRRNDQVIESSLGEALASLIPGADYIALDGRAHLPWAERPDDLFEVIERFLTDAPRVQRTTRRLATVVFVDTVDSTRMMSELGDEAWRHLVDDVDRVVNEESDARHGTVVRGLGDGSLTTFDLPGDAITFATAVRARSARLGLTTRAGIHSGEVETRGDDVVGRVVVTAAGLCRLAPPRHVYCSATTIDLAAGRGLVSHEVGLHALEAIPNTVSVHDVDPPAPDESEAIDSAPRFVRSGAVWDIAYLGEAVTVRHSKGIGDLAVLCLSPRTDVDVRVLMDGPDAPRRSSGDDVLDREAIEAYRARLGAIEIALDEADAAADAELSAAIDDERTAIIEQLRAASGLGQRTRRLGDDVERARKAVSGRVRNAIGKIHEVHPSLGTHLSETITTGRVCRYR